MKHQKAEVWKIEDECQQVQDLVKGSALWPGIQHSQVVHDSVVTAALRERYNIETDTFHFPFGEIVPILDDMHSIAELKLEGKCVHEGVDGGF